MQQAPRLRVLLADDHKVVGEGVRAMLARDFEVVGFAKDCWELLRLAVELRPNVIITDIAMPNLTGLEATERLKTELPDCPVVIFSAQENPTYIRAAMRAGAKGYVLKTKSDELGTAIRSVIRGKTYLPEIIDGRELAKSAKEGKGPLSPREREVLQLLADGKAGKEIAAITGVSVRTIEFHKYNIMNKLSLRSTAELVKYAIQEGITGSI